MTDTRAMQKGLALMFPAVLFGFLVATQWATLALPGSQDVGIRYIDPLSGTVTRLQEEQTSLKAQLTDIRAKLDDLQRTAAAQSGAVRDLQVRIEDLKATAGLTEARGEGVVVTVDTVRAPGAKEQERGVCLAPDLTDIVNAAWRGGARAVAVNDERLVVSSSVYCVGATIVVNGTIVSAPFAVSAVGPPATILGVIDDPTQLRDLKRRRDQLAIDLRVTRSPLLTLPPYTGPLSARSAKPE
ncbi:MAG: DUF881 domain-containing protein [Chloroflexi bacterium]|nr:DUF881 domain-containing protein [Chloroflexota bacterium]